MVKLFTSFVRNPLHPRLEMQLNYFREQDIEADCSFDDKPAVSAFDKLRMMLCLKYFRWDLITDFNSRLPENQLFTFMISACFRLQNTQVEKETR